MTADMLFAILLMIAGVWIAYQVIEIVMAVLNLMTNDEENHEQNNETTR